MLGIKTFFSIHPGPVFKKVEGLTPIMAKTIHFVKGQSNKDSFKRDLKNSRQFYILRSNYPH